MHIHIAILRVDVCIAQSDSYRFVHDTFVSKTRSCLYLKRRLIAVPYNAKSRLEYEFGLDNILSAYLTCQTNVKRSS